MLRYLLKRKKEKVKRYYDMMFHSYLYKGEIFMKKEKKIKDPKALSIYIESEHIDHLRRIASKMTLREGRYISVSELIRDTLAEVYSFTPEIQLELFKKVSKRKLRRIADKKMNAFKEDQLEMF